jgi:predicted dehydrogenase
MNFASGLVVQAGSTYGAAPSSFINVQGTKGWVALYPAFPFEEERRLTAQIGGRRIEKVFPVIAEFALELEAFAKAIQTNGKVEPDGVQGLRDVQIINAIYESGRSRKPVAVDYR